MVHDADEHLIKAHEDRMQATEDWCRELKEAVDLKASTKMAWGILTTFLIISMAVVGWLWDSQVKVATKLEKYQDSLTGYNGILVTIDKKLDNQKTLMEQHMNLKHTQGP